MGFSTPKQRFTALESKKSNGGLTEEEVKEFNVLDDALGELIMDEVIKYCGK